MDLLDHPCPSCRGLLLPIRRPLLVRSPRTGNDMADAILATEVAGYIQDMRCQECGKRFRKVEAHAGAPRFEPLD